MCQAERYTINTGTVYIVSDLIQTIITRVHNNNSSDTLGGDSIGLFLIIYHLF